MHIHQVIIAVILAIYCYGILKYGIGNWKKVILMLLSAILANMVVLFILNGIGFTWNMQSFIGKVIAATIGLSIPFIVATAFFYATPPYKILSAQGKKLYAKIFVAFGMGLITVLPILVPEYKVSLVDLVGLMLTCSITGDCL